MGINNYLNKKRKTIDKALVSYLPKPSGYSRALTEAMRYSVLVGGKRIRPILMLAIADIFDKPYAKVIPAACAVEYIHTSTLILDDLPCMDNSDLRRGKVSLHKKFGQSTAVLVSYSLIMLAFELLIKNAEIVSSDCRLAAGVIKSMSEAAGFRGVCAGQFVDLKSGSKKIDIETLRYLHERKTAALFVGCCEISGYLSGANKKQMQALRSYGKYSGLAFQAYDDILSIKKTEKQLGKQTKKDENSPNIINLFGLYKSNNMLDGYVNSAEKQLSIFGKKADVLRMLLKYNVERNK